MAKTNKRKNEKREESADNSVKDVDLVSDAVTIVGTAIGVVGGAAHFIGSKVAEAVKGKSGKQNSTTGKATKKGSANKAGATKETATGKATKKSSTKKGAAKKTSATK
jgi:hypothetical protein